MLSVAVKATWSSQIAENPEERNPRNKLKTTGFADCRNFWRKKLHIFTCYLWRKKQAGEELCLGQTMSTISNKTATAAPPAPDKARDEIPASVQGDRRAKIAQRRFARIQKCNTNREMPNSKRTNWKPRAWEFPAGTLKRGVFHDVSRFKGLGSSPGRMTISAMFHNFIESLQFSFKAAPFYFISWQNGL